MRGLAADHAAERHIGIEPAGRERDRGRDLERARHHHLLEADTIAGPLQDGARTGQEKLTDPGIEPRLDDEDTRTRHVRYHRGGAGSGHQAISSAVSGTSQK
jgi:hypothetical protein